MKRIPEWLFYVLSISWGCIMTGLGLAVTLIFSIAWVFTRNWIFIPQNNQFGWSYRIGTGWGGVSFGPVAIVAQDEPQSTLDHEFGHAIQNCVFGPGEVIIGIASAARYHWRNWKRKKDPTCALRPYDAIWFEGQATKWGTP